MKSNLVESSTKSKRIPKKFPTWLCKAMWDATAITMKVVAKDELDAWDKAWKQVSRTFGGDSCLRVIVKGRID